MEKALAYPSKPSSISHPAPALDAGTVQAAVAQGRFEDGSFDDGALFVEIAERVTSSMDATYQPVVVLRSKRDGTHPGFTALIMGRNPR